ncbi:MAG: hypothetical protein WCA12_12615 [Burkholderiales bacterium]
MDNEQVTFASDWTSEDRRRARVEFGAAVVLLALILAVVVATVRWAAAA